MSLQIWLPLTKDLRQQGVSNVTVTNNGATFNSAGKLGGCYIFDGADDAISIGNLSALVETNFSFACWFYHSDTWSTKSYETILGGPSGFELEAKNSSTNSPVIKAYSWGGGSFTYELNKWNHLVMTRTSSETKFYLNGELKLTGTAGSIPSGDYFVGAWKTSTSQNYKGNICDVRIYDHCLSPMEVKYISQGLVLHYPLNNMGFGQENLAHNTYGLKPFSTNQVEFKAYDVGLLDVSNGEQITISFDLDMTVATGGSGYLQIYNTNYPGPHQITTGNALAGRTLVTGQDIHERISYTTTMTTRSSSSYSTDRIEFYSNYSTENEIQISNIKIERGNKATPWCPNSSDDLAIQMGLNSNIEYDTSGYCNNGIRTGTFSWTSDTPKYQASIHMPTAATISHPRCLDNTSQEWTCAAWVKPDAAGNYQNLNNFNESNRLYHSTYPLLYLNSGTNDYYNYGNLALPANQWSHIVFVFKNSTGTKLIYVNGENRTNTGGPNKTSTPKGIPDTVIIGGSYAGYMCDYREYATALSAEDVKQLYNSNRL